jgi:hypothetical protein
MIKINLLPDDLKKKKNQFNMPKISIGYFPAIFSAIGLLAAVYGIVFAMININKSAYEKMSREWKVSEPEKKAIEVIRSKNLEIASHVDSIEGLMDEKVFWYRKLNQLSDLIIPGVWYTKIAIDKKITLIEEEPEPGKKKRRGIAKKKQHISPYLAIEGEVSSMQGEDIAILGKYIDKLKQNEEFFADFTNIELDSTELHTILEKDVMKFRINCYLESEARDGSGS